MRILFPSLPGDLVSVDPDFAGELAAAREAGFHCLMFDHGLVERDELGAALRGVPAGNGEPIFHRCWMLTGPQYEHLHQALQYPLIERETAPSIWNESDQVADAWELYSRVSDRPALIKDWVKSAKNRWRDGCFLPAETGRERFESIFAVFREERGDLFNRGVVIRQHLDFRLHGSDMRGLPRIEETRLFFWHGQVLIEPRDEEIQRELQRWESVARRFQSPFITLDIAPLNDGTYKIVETGDGGVSGLPMTIDPVAFFRQLQQRTN